ncbi:unnamed protein product [Bursaphelenchus okinawaensis]|uniref:Homeobox domain-containing protein n=1 Tax=Bursaphelenchus okinawaensis TaxID=465554 RepID=A0A811JWN3_9BILA|nr:unnamed protein product [Bursaphelenchus okinawaensis]CAG9086515.1 unnamed protein product [Bursaphelenchus okinawaensis]
MPEVHYTPSTMDDLLQQLQYIADESLDDNNAVNLKKNALLGHPLKQALYSELVNIKRKTALSIRNQPDENCENPDLARLDNMLLVEHVLGPDPSHYPQASTAGNSTDNTEYLQKLSEIRQEYHQKMTSYEMECSKFTEHVKKLLDVQGQVRPIAGHEIQRMVGICKKRLSRFQIQLKQNVCEKIINLKTRMCDARRKRRNFSKQATQILNDYFHAHIGNPYPSEEVKEELARQCQITVSQVSNWFGNKRIRYKKNIAKAQEEASFYARRQAENSQHALSAAAAAAAAGAMPMLNPYANPAANLAVNPLTSGTDPTQFYSQLPTDLTDFKYFL